MNVELLTRLQGRKLDIWTSFLARSALYVDAMPEKTVLVFDDEDELVATGSRDGNLLKYIAVDETRQGEGLTATVLTALRQDAFVSGCSHLFLYTKPRNKFMFTSLFFYPVAQTDTVLLMEDRKNGVQAFLDGLPVEDSGDPA